VYDTKGSSRPAPQGRRGGKKPVIGVVGGIGAGKSTVTHLLGSLGAGVIESDRLAHEALAAPQVVAELRRWWGEDVVRDDGLIDRGKVAAIVFGRPGELARLEALLYPQIHRRRDELMRGMAADENVRAIVWDAPKLFEAGLQDLCDAVIFVDADRAIRLARVQRSRGWSEAEVDRRESQQKPLDYKKALADHVVTNNSDIDALRLQVERVFSSVLASLANDSTNATPRDR
jgi:dephospho-CoA kinase